MADLTILGLSTLATVASGDLIAVWDADAATTKKLDASNIQNVLDNITVTQAVNLDTMESDIATNSAKVTNATHTGDVTGATELTIATNAVEEAMLASAVQTKLNNTAPSKFDATGAPDANDDSANTGGNGTFAVGSVWINVTGDEAYRCVDATATAAVWISTTLETGELGTIATQNSNAVSITGGTITGITDLAVADGGTGGSDGATARTNLGLVIGTNVQAHSSVLDATTASFLTADETKLDAIEALADVTDVTNVTAAGALMDSEVDADIKTLALPANTTITAFAQTFLDDADAAAVRTTIGAGTGGGDMSDLIDDTTPQLGGDLDVNSQTLVSTSNGNITITPNGTGRTVITGIQAVKTTNTQTGTSYTGVLADAEKVITMNNASANTFTIPANASVAYPVGTELEIIQLGAGATTVAITSDTLNVEATKSLVLAGQYAGAKARKITSTTWVLNGHLADAYDVLKLA